MSIGYVQVLKIQLRCFLLMLRCDRNPFIVLHCIFNAVILKTMLFLVPAGHSYVSLRSFEVKLYILHLSALTQALPPFCVSILE